VNQRRRNTSIAASPILIGAITVLVATVAVFLAYNANNGLPFVPTRTLYADLPDGANLIKGAEVRQGGFRIGVLTKVDARRDEAGRPVARATLKLDEKHADLPVDSLFVVKSRGLLGSKYIDVDGGRAKDTFGDEDVIPIRQTKLPVQFDDVLNTFDARTRRGLEESVTGLGGALAGRGQDLNTTIATLPQLLPPLRRVMSTLSRPKDNLPNLIGALDRTTRALAPVAGRQAHLFAVGADTFGALSRDEDALSDTITESPRTLAVATTALRAHRPFLRHATELADPLERSARALRGALGDLDAAVVAGTPASRRIPAFSERVGRTFTALRDLGQDPLTLAALDGVLDTVGTLNPMLRYIGPYITVCNYWNYFWTLASDITTVRNPVGQSLHAFVAQAPAGQTNGLGQQGATRPVSGGVAAGGPAANLHGQPYGAAINADGTADCEQAQRGYPSRLASYADPDLDIAMDSHTPGSQGPVFDSFDDVGQKNRKLGVPRVPAGQTFSRSPETGPQVPPQAEGGS
jgi:virulence factor Mce-like protein